MELKRWMSNATVEGDIVVSRGLRVPHVILGVVAACMCIAELGVYLVWGRIVLDQNIWIEAIVGIVLVAAVSALSYAQMIRAVVLSQDGVEFRPVAGAAAIVSWTDLRPPRHPPFLGLEVSFARRNPPPKERGQGFWVSRNMGNAILSHPSCSKDGVPEVTRRFLAHEN